MIDLHKFFENPFEAEGISIAELFRFSTDHVQRMTVSNPNGVLTPRLTATGGALTNVYKAHSDDEAQAGLRAAGKLAKDNFRKALPQSIEKLYAAVTLKFGSKSVQMRECFREGRSVFQRVADDGLRDELTAVITGLTNHQPDLADALTLANSLLTGWLAVYDASENVSATKGAAMMGKREARAALQRELYLNLLALAQAFPLQPEKLDEYMQQSLLMNRVHPAEESTPTPTPAPTPA